MATWSWWIVILCSKDYYILYDGARVVRARNANEASRKGQAQAHYPEISFVEEVFGPFADPPGRL